MTDNKTKEFAVLAVEALEDKKAEDRSEVSPDKKTINQFCPYNIFIDFL